MASNLQEMASNPIAMASNLQAMSFNPIAMASTYRWTKGNKREQPGVTVSLKSFLKPCVVRDSGGHMKSMVGNRNPRASLTSLVKQGFGKRLNTSMVGSLGCFQGQLSSHTDIHTSDRTW